MRKLVLAVIAVAAMIFAGGQAAYACEGEEILFEDSFDELDPSWGEYDTFQIVDGKFHVISNGRWLTRAPSNFSVYDDADVCVTTNIVKGPENGSSSGLLFWYIDPQNYYTFEVSPAGTFSVYRLLKDKWLPIVAWKESPAVKKGPDAVNKLRVVTKGKTATVYANGTELAKFKGMPPKDGQIVGVLMQQHFDDQPVTSAFDDFVVSSVPATP